MAEKQNALKVVLEIPPDLQDFIKEESKHYATTQEFILTVLRNEKVCLKDFDEAEKGVE